MDHNYQFVLMSFESYYSPIINYIILIVFNYFSFTLKPKVYIKLKKIRKKN